jgi:hypothetical protein
MMMSASPSLSQSSPSFGPFKPVTVDESTATPKTTIKPRNADGVANGNTGGSQLGYGPSFGYNPYPAPYSMGIPNKGFSQLPAYGLPAVGGMPYGNIMGGMPYGNMMGGMPYGGGYPAMAAFGNPYGGYQNFTDFGTGNTSYNVSPTGSAPGYGFEKAVSPTVFQAPLSGDGTLPSANPARLGQELYAQTNANRARDFAGWTSGALAAGLALAFTPFKRKLPWLSFLTAAGSFALGNILVGRMVEPVAYSFLKENYAGRDYADNGSVDNSYSFQRDYKVN